MKHPSLPLLSVLKTGSATTIASSSKGSSVAGIYCLTCLAFSASFSSKLIPFSHPLALLSAQGAQKAFLYNLKQSASSEFTHTLFYKAEEESKQKSRQDEK
jgi:hypothetical protein